MKKISFLGTALLVLVLSGLLASCASSRIKTVSKQEVPLTVSNLHARTTYHNLGKSVRLNITSTISDDMVSDNTNLPPSLQSAWSQYKFAPSVRDFALDVTTRYMQDMRFDIAPTAEYCLDVEIKNFDLVWINNNSAACQVVINYRLLDGSGQTVVPSSTVNTKHVVENVCGGAQNKFVQGYYQSAKIILALSANAKNRAVFAELFGQGFGRAYAAALDKINWDRIAKCLTVADTPKQEANAQVTGAGDTALEHTVIRWYIISAPQGADVMWRVVSSTPDVANTNFNFVGSTPYETTESFDIKGMTYNNAGNIQIEISCEKPGYITQRKRFNLRQAIDQKEISTKFNLIKDE